MVTEELIFRTWSVLEAPLGYEVMIQTQLINLYERFQARAIDKLIDLLDQYDAIEEQEQTNAITRDSAIKKAAVVEWEVGKDLMFIKDRKADIRRQILAMLALPDLKTAPGVTRLYRS